MVGKLFVIIGFLILAGVLVVMMGVFLDYFGGVMHELAPK